MRPRVRGARWVSRLLQLRLLYSLLPSPGKGLISSNTGGDDNRAGSRSSGDDSTGGDSRAGSRSNGDGGTGGDDSDDDSSRPKRVLARM